MIIQDYEKQHYLTLATVAITAHLSNEPIPEEIITQAQKNPTSDEKAGVFVTLKKHHQLRGCIGCITSTEPLLTTIPNFAIKAAIDDPRFQAVTINEISTIEVSLSILTPPSPAINYTQIQIGTHGIIFEYNHHRSVFLPEVPIEQQWDLVTTLKHLERKANAPLDSWKKASYQTFKSIKI